MISIIRSIIQNINQGILVSISAHGLSSVLNPLIQRETSLIHGRNAPLNLQLRHSYSVSQFLAGWSSSQHLSHFLLCPQNAFVIFVQSLWDGNNTRLKNLRPFDRRTNPVHGIGGETKATIRIEFFGCTNECLVLLVMINGRKKASKKGVRGSYVPWKNHSKAARTDFFLKKIVP